MRELALITLVGAAAFYLGHRAFLTRFIWSRYPRWLDRLMGCSACLGTWAGGFTAWWLIEHGRAVLGVVGVPAIFAGACAGMILTPIASAVALYALHMLSDPAGGDQA